MVTQTAVGIKVFVHIKFQDRSVIVVKILLHHVFF